MNPQNIVNKILGKKAKPRSGGMIDTQRVAVEGMTPIIQNTTDNWQNKENEMKGKV
jgi:hypothetical protein